MVKKKGASYFSILICAALLGVFGVAEGAQKEGGLKELQRVRGGVAVSWASRSAPRVQIDTPTIIAEDPKTKAKLPIALKLTSHSTKHRAAVLDYQVVLGGGDRGIGGTLRVSMALPQEGKSELLLHETELKFDRPVQMDVTVQYRFQIRDTLATKMVLPERNGYLRSYPLSPGRPGAGRYELGAQAARGSKCPQLGIPVVGLTLGGRQLAVSIDPYCGGRIETSRDGKHTFVTVSTTYHGSVVPLTSEKRTVALEFHRNGVDGMLHSFYHTIPEIKPGAAWIHDVHLVYYDYLSDGGEGWFKGLKHLADRIPREHRGRVAACLHGWYDYFQQYAYDHKSGKLLKKWVAFPGTRKTPMSLEGMHKRIKFAKDLGFRTLLYFADGTNSDSGAPAFRKEYVFRDKNGKTVKGWKGPDSLGQPLRMDPAVPGLRDWYKGYLKALLEEYGGEVDGLVWDETFYMPVGAISYSQKTPAYADRAMMSLVSEMTQIVQQYRKRNPDLVFLASDIGKTTYALVSHGTYQDSDMRIRDWAPGMFANYRNCLWSCNWHPVRHGGSRNRHAAEALGLPQGLSNGYGDNKGPHEMPKELFEAVLQRFLKNIKNSRQRTRYLTAGVDAAPMGLKVGKAAGKGECIRKIDLKDFGGMVARFGDLNGDGQADVVFVQSAGQKITCITALDLNGKRLWQRGKADEKHRSLSSDVAIQIYDWDNDKANEVLVIEGKTLRILDGATGKVEREAPVASNDSILIANFAGASRANDLMIKDRYKNIWVYDKNLKLQWTRKVNTGHFPMNVDLDGDGRDELLCGYTLFDRDGKVRWAHDELPEHNDAVDADDMDGDGRIEIAIACSRDSALLSADGKILWRKPHKHSQHAVIGAFVPGKAGKQVVFVDRIAARTRSGKWNPDGGIAYCYDKAGKELWRTAPQGGITIASTIDGWTGGKKRSFVLLYRRYKGPPVLLDGSGKCTAEFPFPPAKADSGYGQHFAQHFDALGDAREEVFVYNPLALWIYRNAAPAPPDLPKPKRGANRRIYNATFYVGWQ